MNIYEHLYKKIESANVDLWPWEHLHIEELIPNDLYVNLREFLIGNEEQDKFRERSKFRHDKMLFSLSRDMRIDTPYVMEYIDMLFLNEDIIKMLVSKFNTEHSYIPDMERHNPNISRSLTERNTNREIVDMYSEYDVLKQGFDHPIHQDVPPKFISLVHYFAEDGDDETLGTRLYPGWKVFNKPIHDDSHSKDVSLYYEKTIPYLPNSSLIFSPSDQMGHLTNHHFQHLSEKTEFRRAIHSFYLLETSAWAPTGLAY